MQAVKSGIKRTPLGLLVQTLLRQGLVEDCADDRMWHETLSLLPLEAQSSAAEWEESHLGGEELCDEGEELGEEGVESWVKVEESQGCPLDALLPQPRSSTAPASHSPSALWETSSPSLSTSGLCSWAPPSISGSEAPDECKLSLVHVPEVALRSRRGGPVEGSGGRWLHPFVCLRRTHLSRLRREGNAALQPASMGLLHLLLDTFYRFLLHLLLSFTSHFWLRLLLPLLLCIHAVFPVTGYDLRSVPHTLSLLAMVSAVHLLVLLQTVPQQSWAGAPLALAWRVLAAVPTVNTGSGAVAVMIVGMAVAISDVVTAGPVNGILILFLLIRMGSAYSFLLNFHGHARFAGLLFGSRVGGRVKDGGRGVGGGQCRLVR
ncbi:hypothetical protein JZ751_012579 [Albula glossodonta]|uniref:Uncharacterized protein n=1 Tax=Albula glossodonta TaxID=121402 RepID=A0A8T2NV90_9TELE|nr:hypothetical protein JZ751_012579 [Albula glossodonta]